MPTYDVNTKVRIRLDAKDEKSAANHALDALQDHLGQIADNYRVVEVGIPLTETNPEVIEVRLPIGFRTSDGYTLNRVALLTSGRVIWTNGDLTFDSDQTNTYPETIDGIRLEGEFLHEA